MKITNLFGFLWIKKLSYFWFYFSVNICMIKSLLHYFIAESPCIRLLRRIICWNGYAVQIPRVHNHKQWTFARSNKMSIVRKNLLNAYLNLHVYKKNWYCRTVAYTRIYRYHILSKVNTYRGVPRVILQSTSG